MSKLIGAAINLNVVVLPDFFLDHSSTFNFDAQTLARRILSVASRGGGEITGVQQGLEVGGNAAICTLALAKLGVNVHPIMKTDDLGLLLMRHFYRDPRIDLSRIKLSGVLSPTTILELRKASSATNIMLGDSSRITPFGFDELDSDDLRTITESDYVCVFNWVYNRRGTDLAQHLFEYCHQNSSAHTFFDAADARPRVDELPDLKRKVLKLGLIDAWGLNENEAVMFGNLYKRLRGRGSKVAFKAGRILSANSGAKVYLHSADYSASILNDDVTVIPAFAVKALRGTGAGDTWNAAIIVAHALELSEQESLLFANAVAGRYVSNPKRVYSTLGNMVEFLKDSAIKLKRAGNGEGMFSS